MKKANENYIKRTVPFFFFLLGHFGGNQANYSLDMSYDDMYRITRKKQELSQSNIQFEDTLFSGYELDYAYSTTPGKRFQMASVGDVNYRTDEEPTEDDAVVENHCYEYDNNGNIIYVNTSRTMPDVGFQSGEVEKMREERFRWDEENRLLAVSQNGYVSQYWYDADGERVVKEHGANQAVFVNSEEDGTVTQTDKYSVYPNGYYSYGDDGRYTKHIYIGAERIASQVGVSLTPHRILSPSVWPDAPTESTFVWIILGNWTSTLHRLILCMTHLICPIMGQITIAIIIITFSTGQVTGIIH